MLYTHYFAVLSSNVQSIIVAGGYPFLFLSVFLEGLPLIGTVVPGHVAIIAAGFLARVGPLNVWLVLALAIGGALAGDYMGFSLGRRYGLGLIDRLRPYFFISDAQLARTQALLERHTGKALILGRLSPMTRALMPFLVGTGNVPKRRFWLFNVIGGTIWVGASVALGYAFGFGYRAIEGYAGKFAVIAVILASLIVWGYHFANMRFRLFRKYELFVLILNIAALWALLTMVQDAWSLHPFFANLDLIVNAYMSYFTGQIAPYAATVAQGVSFFGDTITIGTAGTAIGGWLIIRGKWRSGLILFMSLASTAFLVGFMKEFFLRARPLDALVLLTDPSFPSAHAAMSAAFFTIICYLLMPRIRSWVKRELAMVAAVVIVIVVGLSRLVLNVHWASDVFAGWSLGLFCATASILLVRYVGFLVKRH